jgi:hypothetical protein
MIGRRQRIITRERRQVMSKDQEFIDREIAEAAKILAPVFSDNNWTWAGRGVPSENDIDEKFHFLLNKAKEGNHKSCSTGRLVVRRNQEGSYDTYSYSFGLSLGTVWDIDERGGEK